MATTIKAKKKAKKKTMCKCIAVNPYVTKRKEKMIQIHSGLLQQKYMMSKLGCCLPFTGCGHIGTGPRHCHFWESNAYRGDSL